MAESFAFSQASIKALKIPEAGRQEFSDSGTKHLMVRVSSTGSKVFYWFGRAAGKLKREKLGEWPEMGVAWAKREAARLTGLKAQGKPVVAKRTQVAKEWTLVELFDWYLETHSKPHKRTWEWDERQFKRVLSSWANRAVSLIHRTEVQSLHLKLGKERGLYAANKMLELLGHMFRLGNIHDKDRVPCEDPTRGIRRFPKEERERFLDCEELPRFMNAVEQLARQESKDFMMLCLWTGARRSNVCQMRWDELSMESGVWNIPREKSKNKKPMQIVLSPPALQILERRKANSRSVWVIPGQGKNGHYNDPKGAWKQVLEWSGLKNLRIHDLRRTLGSWMATELPLQVVGRQLGHSSIKSTAIYARLANRTLQDAVSGTAARMMNAMAASK